MKIMRNGEEIELTDEEVMEAYSSVDMEMRLSAAKNAFINFVDAMFDKAYGLTYSGATDKDSDDFILKELVQDFIIRHDPSVAETSTWETVVKDYMDKRRARERNHSHD